MKTYYVIKDPNQAGYRLSGTKGALLTKANQYLNMLGVRGLSILTIRTYAYDLLLIFRWLVKSKKSFKSLTEKDLVFLTQYQQAHHYKPTSINKTLIICEVFYRFCYGVDLPVDICMSYPNAYYKPLSRDRRKKGRKKFRVKIPKTLVATLEAHEVIQFLKNVSRYRDIAIVFMMLYGGLRASEVLSLSLSNLHLTEGRMRVRGKGNQERDLPLSNELISSIEQYLRLERPAFCQTDILFVVLQGKHKSQPMSYSGLRSLFRSYRKRSGIKKANPHRFRHLFGTSMAREGVQLPALQKMMGHQDFKTTLRYIHFSAKDISVEYQKAMKNIKEQYEKC